MATDPAIAYLRYRNLRSRLQPSQQLQQKRQLLGRVPGQIVVLRITDREAWTDTVERESVTVGYGGEVRWPHSSAWYVTDPTGYEIEVALWDDDTVRFGS